MIGSGSSADLNLYKVQMCKVWSSSNVFLGVWSDAPLLTGVKTSLNGATPPITVKLPRAFDLSLPDVQLENIVEYRVYGPNLSQSGKIVFKGFIDNFEPSIDAKSGKECIDVTLVPYSTFLGDRYVSEQTSFGRSSVLTSIRTALVNGNNYTSLDVKSLSQPFYVGDTPTLSSQGHTQVVTVAQDTSIGDTIVYVNSFMANFSYPSARSSYSTRLKAALTNGNNYTSITVPKVTRQYFNTDTITLSSNGHTQTLNVSSTANIGDTVIHVSSFTANYSYPLNSSVSLVVTGTTLTLDLSAEYSDPVEMFNYFFNTIDDSTGLGLTFTNPLTLDPSNPTSSGITLQYTFSVQKLLAALEQIRLMLPPNWFYRTNWDNTVTLNVPPTTPQHIFFLGQHVSDIKYSQDATNLKNVAVIQGRNTVSGTASGSDLALYGQRVIAQSDNRITDNNTAQQVAQGVINIYDQVVTRAPITLVDYRGDSSGLGYDIESIEVGDTIEIIDTGGINTPTIWGEFQWGEAPWGFSAGAIFNQVVTIYELVYNFDTVEITIGAPRANYNKKVLKVLQALVDNNMLNDQ